MKVPDVFETTGLIVMFFLGGCMQQHTNPQNSSIRIELTDDSTAIEVLNIPAHAILHLKNDTLTLKQWHNIVSVVADTSSREAELKFIEGAYTLTDSGILFTPKIPFRKGVTYQVECYIQKPELEPEKIVVGQEQLFKRNFIIKTFNF